MVMLHIWTFECMAWRFSGVGQLRGCDRALGVRVLYGVCSGLRYKMMQPTVRREDLKKQTTCLKDLQCSELQRMLRPVRPSPENRGSSHPKQGKARHGKGVRLGKPRKSWPVNDRRR